MNYGFLAGAEPEYLEAIRFFEEQRAGLGAALIFEFERVVGWRLKGPIRGNWFTQAESGASD